MSDPPRAADQLEPTDSDQQRREFWADIARCAWRRRVEEFRRRRSLSPEQRQADDEARDERDRAQRAADFERLGIRLVLDAECVRAYVTMEAAGPEEQVSLTRVCADAREAAAAATRPAATVNQLPA